MSSDIYRLFCKSFLCIHNDWWWCLKHRNMFRKLKSVVVFLNIIDCCMLWWAFFLFQLFQKFSYCLLLLILLTVYSLCQKSWVYVLVKEYGFLCIKSNISLCNLQSFGGRPSVFVSATYARSTKADDAMYVWLENVNSGSFEVCIREFLPFDGKHQDTIVVSKISLTVYSEALLVH